MRARRAPASLACLAVAVVVGLVLTLGVSRLPEASAADPGLEFRDAWPGATFDKPTCVAAIPDGSDRLFVALRGGKVMVIRKYRGADPVPQPKVFVDLSSAIPQALLDSSQAGLVTVAPHPNYKSNGRLFLFYGTAGPQGGASARSEVVEVKATAPAADTANPASRRVILSVSKPDGAAHFGGGLAFGPDGMLYVGLGDSGMKTDPQALGQNAADLRAKILRIDVDRAGGGAPYAIPADNPFVGAPGGVRGEIWAVGVRNPFRISFDAKGTLWMGDPGEKQREEINVVPRGGNLGWPLKEGSRPGRAVPGVNPGPLVDPVFEYDRTVGKASIGGVVYRGQRCPSLSGNYVFSDYMLSKVFALTLDASGRRVTGQRVLAEVPNVMSINEDAEGELYFCQLDDDHILTVVPKS